MAEGTPIPDIHAKIAGKELVSMANHLTEQRRAEVTMDDVSIQMRAIVEAAVDAIIIIDEKGMVEFFNPAAERMFGYTAYDVLGNNVKMLMPSPYCEEHNGYLERYLKTREPRILGFPREVPGKRRDGTIFPLELSVNEVNLAHRCLFSGILRDITDRKRVEAVIAQLKRQHELILQSAGEGIYGLDLQGNTTFLNPAAARMIGWEAQELIGKPQHSILHHSRPDGTPYPREACPIYAAFQDGAVHHVDTEVFWRKDGTSFPVEYTSNPIHDEQGFLVGSVVTFRDITDRKQSEERLAQQVRLARFGEDVGVALNQSGTLVEGLQGCAEAMVQHLNATFACIWTINEEQHVLQLQVSAGMYTHIDGAHSRVPIGKLKIGLIAKERKPHLTNSVIGDPRVPEQEWAKREGMVAFAGYPLIVDDRVVGVAAMFAHQPLADSTLQALASVADGIALGIKRKQVEEQIKKALKEKEVLLKEIHHRVKNNLQIVSSLLNLQAGRLGNEQLREPFRISQNRLQAMILLHEQLYQSKNLAEIQYGEYITRQAQELFRVYGVDHDTITLQILSENINVNIDKAIPFGLILTELLSNALKYAFPSNKKGTLTIQLSAEHDGFITLRVSDNGVGFPGSLDFRRSDTLGMRLVCALTEQLEGTMELRREGGTEFVIRFPN